MSELHIHTLCYTYYLDSIHISSGSLVASLSIDHLSIDLSFQVYTRIKNKK